MSARPVAEVMEDLEFLDSTGAGATDAARRTDFPSPHAMEKWLERLGRYDLWQSLKHRDPEGVHDSANRKQRRLMSIETQQIDSIAVLITEGQKSTRARTRNRADKISDLVSELRETLHAEREDDERREQARKEVQRLERELTEAKARLRGGGGSTTLDVDGSVTAAELREWARINGVECPAMGRVPAAVREAYEAANEDEAEAS